MGLLFLLAQPVLGWQDDVDLIFLKRVFNTTDELTFLPKAHAQLRLGRYFLADSHHGWRGGAEGEVALLSINKRLLWHWGLNMETLVDDQNDINFRLVQVYYQTKTGLSWQIGPGVLTWAYQHRCSHGADSAVLGRILIRSGVQANYNYTLSLAPVLIDLRAGLDIYIIGQNADNNNQARGALKLSTQARMPVKNNWSMLIAGGFMSELRGASENSVYNLTTPAKNLILDNLFGIRIALNYEKEGLNNDYALSFSQIGDTGLSAVTNKHTGVSFDVNFYW